MSPEPTETPPTDPTGCWVFMVGPSGAGKDTLLELTRSAVADLARIRFARRVVTRPANDFEDHESIDVDAFDAMQSRGGFALSWRAHGLAYGIPAKWRDEVDGGAIVVCNVSRTVVAPAREQLGAVRTVLVTAPADVLARRIALRGREASAGQRLSRDLNDEVNRYVDLVIDNTGTPAEGAAPLIALLRELHGSAMGDAGPSH